ncbi:MAG: hypothetical protein AB1611_07815 [bacterium]
MRKYFLSLVILISILFTCKPATSQMIPFPGYWGIQNFAFGYPALYPAIMPPLAPPAGVAAVQPPVPLLLMPQISVPSPVRRFAAATITIFSVPTLSTIQVTAVPAVTTSLNATTTATSSYTFILPSLLTIPTSPYIQTQTAALTAVFPISPLIGTTTAIAPGLAAGLAPVI